MSKIVGLSRLALQVRNVQNARVFYEQVLGLEVASAAPDRVQYNTEPPIEIRAALVELDAANAHLTWGCSVVLRSENVEALFERVRIHNARITRPLSGGPFGYSFDFQDPDGHRLTAVAA